MTFPGARVEPVITKWVRLDQARAEFIRDFLERSDVVQIPEASLQNVSKRQGKLQYRLRQNRFRTWKKLGEEMTRAGFEKTCYRQLRHLEMALNLKCWVCGFG